MERRESRAKAQAEREGKAMRLSAREGLEEAAWSAVGAGEMEIALRPPDREGLEERLAALGARETGALYLTREEAGMVARAAEIALNDTGRVEFGDFGAETVARAFLDSPWIERGEWAETLMGLTEMFYACKSATKDQVGDEALISLMRRLFDGRCRGSIELLGDALNDFAHGLPVAEEEAEE